MAKPLLLVAVLANFLLLTSCTDSTSSNKAVSTRSKPSKSSSTGVISQYSKDNSTATKSKCKKNEIFVQCPEAVCVPKCCEDVGFPVACPDFLPNATCPSPPGCICKENYVRNCNGNCIPMEKCPSCGGDLNAKSGCGTNCNRLCSNWDKKPGKCDQECLYNACECKPNYVFDEIKGKCVDPDECSSLECGLSICRCKDGFYRDDEGNCVPLEKCPVCPGVNEVFNPCPPPCPAQRCDVDVATILCAPSPQLGDPECDPSCVCIDGYVRDYNGTCIPREDCPQCPDNEMLDACINPCLPRRCDVDDRLIRCAAPPKLGDPNCEAGCRCIDNYKRDSDGKCIPQEDCPQCFGENQEYNNCTQGLCRTQNCTEVGFPAACPKINPKKCITGCVCTEGFVRDEYGDCVSLDECPSCGGDFNATSGCGVYCNQRCSDIGKEPGACIEVCYDNACDCKEGYYYDNTSQKCVLPEDCPSICKENEYYNNCSNSNCSPQSCKEVGFPIDCEEEVDQENCVGGCLCLQGYLRNSKGKCVPANKCPSCGGDENAVPGCGVYCNQRCTDIGKPSGPCILICFANACDCKKGYYLNETTNKCVLPEDCTPQCPENEYFNNCTNGDCSIQNCTQVGKPIACARIDPKFCKKGCLCNEGYARNSKGKCIHINNCPSQCPENEYFNNCTNGDCSVQNCTKVGKLIACARIDPKFCKKGCLCNEGYARNSKGKCIPINNCPSCGGDFNATSGCGVYCNQRCSDIGKEPGACIEVCYDNACDCKEGYYYDNTSQKCVLPEDCPSICKENEYYNNCSNSNCSPQSCKEVGFPIDCEEEVDQENCVGGCLCLQGYVRNSKGKCVPANKCPSCGGDENAVPGCGVYCNQRCTDIGKPSGPCILICFANACDCKKGYYLNETTNKCVLPEDCTPQCPENEYFNNCTNGDCSVQNCTQVGKPIACARIDPKFCKNGCLCNEGYARNSKGKCIPINDCPPQCPKNEYFNNCTNGDCSIQNCTQVGKPIACARINPKFCKKGCLCNEGYARNSKGKCIPIKSCPSCGGDKNAVSGCGVYCNQRCRDIGQEPNFCITICYDNACDCKEGYYLDENTERCVKPENCTPTCDLNNNEVYSDCINGGCQAKNCTQLGKDIPCKKLDPKSCIKGCLCKEGYLRAENGTCVPQNECYPTCSGLNEEYNPCPPKCPPQTCKSIGKRYNCPLQSNNTVCEGKCVCKKGFYRNNNGDCISKENCLKCTGPREFYACGGACDNVCATLKIQNQTSCPIINVRCNDMCYCEKNYARAKNNTCIPIRCCDEPQCNINERYETCPGKLPGPQKCSELGFPLQQGNKCGKPKCVCNEGYVKNDKGLCIPQEECPTCPGQNEEYSSCIFDCPPQTCDSLDKAYACPIREDFVCKGGCRCIAGFYRNKINECISEENCRKCNKDPHQYYSCGGACDNVCATIKQQNQTSCPILNIKCNEMCYCEKNYARAKNNTCIPIKCCNDPQCNINERYEKCPEKLSGPQKCSQLGFPVQQGTKCGRPKCVCIDGYVKNDKGLCIPKEECPSCGGDSNAKSGCGVNCNKQCTDLGKDESFCIEVCYDNSCDCKDGYYYDKVQQKCVLKEDCNTTQICGKNEVYNNCTNPDTPCQAKYCSDLGFPLNCSDPPVCQKGCVCEDNYVRDDSGKCIPVRDCPSCGGDSNAMSGCGVNCLKLCSDLKNPKRPRPCPRICNINACDCRDGFYLDENTMKCVKPKQCSPICGEDEVYDLCVNDCGLRKCSQLEEDEDEDDDEQCIEPKSCKKGCSCQKDFLRSKNGTCIPMETCPEAKCDKRERFEICPAALCEPLTCDDLGYPIACPDLEEEGCPGKPGCVCIDGYVRNKKGRCIEKRDCPSCGGDPYAWSGCGVNCGKRCDDVNNKPYKCPKICKPNSCDCKDGYFYNDVAKKCVRDKKCTPLSCPENEIVDICVNGGCGIRNCSQIDGPEICVLVDECFIGCTCIDGYLRMDSTGVCVPRDQCRQNLTICPEATTTTTSKLCYVPPSPVVNETTAVANFETGNMALTGQFLYQLVISRPGESFIFSALSVLISLAILTLNAVGVAAEQLLRLLNLKTKDEVLTVFPLIIRDFKSQQSVVAELAVKYYGNINYPFNPTFEQQTRDVFNSDSENLDFSQNIEAADTINKWVTNQTNNLIDNLISPDMLNADTRLMLINALYFLGDWLYQFNPDYTMSRDFFIGENQTGPVDTMYLKKNLQYAESADFDCKMLRLEYKGGNFTLDIYLPNEVTGLEAMVSKLKDTENFKKSQALYQFQSVEAYIPKITIESSIDNITDLLKMLNVTAVFESTDSFKGILENDVPLFISSIIQKGVIKVNEVGTEAAVATGITVSTTAVQLDPPKVYVFDFNHPGVIFLMLNGEPVLCGVFTGK